MQHPPELIHELLRSFDEGYEIVYTIRNYPKDNNFLKNSWIKYLLQAYECNWRDSVSSG